MPDLQNMQVIMATSNDSRFPPKNITDGKMDTFWASTGLYPQSFVLSLSDLTDVNNIMFHSFNVKDMVIEKSVKEDPVDFEEIFQSVLDVTEGSLQKKTVSPESCSARYLKFIIKSGYDHFCAVYKLTIT